MSAIPELIAMFFLGVVRGAWDSTQGPIPHLRIDFEPPPSPGEPAVVRFNGVDMQLGGQPPEDPVQKAVFDALTNILTLPVPRAAKRVSTLSPVNRRLIEERDRDNLAFQHTVLCQTSLPYRDPGDDVRLWEREQGAVSLRVEAGAVSHPRTQEWIELGLPWGTKPRLILAYLNAEALRRSSPVIEVESSISAFVERIRGFQHGREIRAFKDQLSRLSVVLVRLAMTRGERAFQIDTKVVTAFELWPEKDERQRVLWPSTIILSPEYFASLQKHAVPLYEADLAKLAHSAMALDVYAWLAQRLHRVTPTKPEFVPWAALKEQFGPDYGRMDNFKRFFRKTLGQVLTCYNSARLDLDDRGITLHHSPPPVAKTQVQLPPKSDP